MREFNIGDRVMTIENNEVRKGTIKQTYIPFPDVVIVEFDDGDIEKVRTETLALEPKSEIAQNKPTGDQVEKSEITITPGEFRNTGVNLIIKLTAEKPIVGFALTAFLVELHKALFFGEVSENS